MNIAPSVGSRTLNYCSFVKHSFGIHQSSETYTKSCHFFSSSITFLCNNHGMSIVNVNEHYFPRKHYLDIKMSLLCRRQYTRRVFFLCCFENSAKMKMFKQYLNLRVHIINVLKSK